MATVVAVGAGLGVVGALQADPPATPHGTTDPAFADCAGCHTERPAPAVRVLRNDCAECHGKWGVQPVNHLESAARDRGTSVRPDPRLAGNQALILRDMVRVPAGAYILGDDSRHADEGPMQTFSLPAFHLDRLEVTNGDYARFTTALRRAAPGHWTSTRPPGDLLDHPVVEVSWYDARDYCAWRGKRLPTEFEWEKAARGVEGLKFPWGDIFDATLANTPQSGIGHTTPVGRFPNGASPYGVLDMSGNVWEWTDSWYQPYPGNARSNPNYGKLYRIVRGGSWFDCEFYKCGISAPTYNRGFFIPNTRNDTFGFRCAWSEGGAPPGPRAQPGLGTRSIPSGDISP